MLSTLCAENLVKIYQEKAHQRHLSEERYWHLLLHVNGHESEIDDVNFFLSSEGKQNPQSELNATINALLQEEHFDDNATACRYPARTMWLQQQLHMRELPQVTCSALNAMIQKVDPKSATFVFPSAHINSPASMFGHTFLRIDSSYDSKLLSHAVNYSATTGDDKENGAVFAIKGLFGGYRGIYSLLPYYDKLKEYSDTEQRDIWEYELNLSEAEVRRMLLHVWELSQSYSWYYFFDENCSYNMLWLIEIARPSVHLREKFFYQVLPINTVFALEEAGLVAQKYYRPSKRKKLLAYERILGERHAREVIAVVQGERSLDAVLDTMPSVQTKRYFLEASSELLEYWYIENKISADTYKERFHTTLQKRSTLGQGTVLSIEKPTNPDQSHRANLLTFQVAYQDNSHYYLLGFRPVYHTLVDSDQGLLRGTQIEFLKLLLRYSRHDKLEVEALTLLSLASIAQRTLFFNPISWRATFEWNRNYRQDTPLFEVALSAGWSWGNAWSYWYALGTVFSYFHHAESMGVGSTLGLVMAEGRAFKTNIEWRERLYIDGSTQSLLQVSQLWRLHTNQAVKLQYDYVERAMGEKQTVKLVFDYFF